MVYEHGGVVYCLAGFRREGMSLSLEGLEFIFLRFLLRLGWFEISDSLVIVFERLLDSLIDVILIRAVEILFLALVIFGVLDDLIMGEIDLVFLEVSEEVF